MNKINLKVSTKTVPITIGNNIITRKSLDAYVKTNNVVVITNTTVARLYLKDLKKVLYKRNIFSYVLPDGEKYKNINSLNKIHDYLIKSKLNRDITILAFGGGVIGDIAAFAADTFLRGVPLIHIPTTLLAQVDSSMGGKCGINHTLGKNLIGSFKHPEAVLIDIKYLKTLTDKEYISGLAEVVKYGAISNPSFLKWLNKYSNQILNRQTTSLIKLINTSVKEKVKIVHKDEKESNIRAYLNFGHTLGHAVESAMDYKKILHGEAISLGMVFASALSVEKTSLTIDEFNLIVNTLEKFCLPIQIPSKLKTTKIMQHMDFDKKKKDGKINFVLLKSLGECMVFDRLSRVYISKMVNTFQR